MAETKSRRGFKGKIVLCDLYTFDPHVVVKAFDKDGQTYLQLDNGDAMIIDFITICDNMIEAWTKYADNVEKICGVRPIRVKEKSDG